MKVIDLLVKISKGEEVPKKIKFNEEIYKFNEIDDDYEGLYGGDWLLHNHNDNLKCFLNDEVEVIQEKEIEHYDMFDFFTGYKFGGTDKTLLEHLEKNFSNINQELDYLIKAVNDMRDKE